MCWGCTPWGMVWARWGLYGVEYLTLFFFLVLGSRIEFNILCSPRWAGVIVFSLLIHDHFFPYLYHQVAY